MQTLIVPDSANVERRDTLGRECIEFGRTKMAKKQSRDASTGKTKPRRAATSSNPVADPAKKPSARKATPAVPATVSVLNFSVQGVVQGADAAPMAGAQVKAFDQDIAREDILGEAVTDDSGYGPVTVKGPGSNCFA